VEGCAGRYGVDGMMTQGHSTMFSFEVRGKVGAVE
jgi:hypothetical protein